MEAVAIKPKADNIGVINLKSEIKIDTEKQGRFSEVFKTTRTDFDKTRDMQKKVKANNQVKDNKDVNKPEQAEKAEKPRKKEESKVAEKKEETVEKKSEVSEDEETKISKDEEKLALIAETLGIDVEMLRNILQNLNMKVSDIKDTGDIKNIIKDVFNLGSDAEILKDSKLSGLIKDIKEIVAGDEKSEGKSRFDMEKLKKEDSKSFEGIDENDKKDENNKKDKKVSKEIEPKVEEQKGNDVIETSATNQEKQEKKDEDGKSTHEMKELKVSDKVNNQEIKVDFNNNPEINAKTILKNEKSTDINIDRMQNKSINPKNLMNQILEKAKVIVTEDKSEIVIKLKPENLGKLTMKIVTEDGLITAKFDAESQKVKEIIESKLEDLKQSLKEQGLKLDSVEVSVRQDNSNEQQNLYKQEMAKSKTYKKNIIDRLMNGNSLGKLNINDSVNPYLVSESRVNYIA